VLVAAVLLASIFAPAKTTALSFNSSPARFWGNILSSDITQTSQHETSKVASLEGDRKSEWLITLSGFPVNAQDAVRYAIDVWSRNFESKVPINVDAVWEADANSKLLGSARPGYYFSAFPGAPDENLWYPSALANTLAGRDLDPNKKEIFLRVNSTPLWYFGTDGNPPQGSYDLVSVVMHEIAHGLGFLSNVEYEKAFGTGYIYQPTPYDAYVQLPDGRTLTDFCSRSLDLGKALTGPLVWSGMHGTAANGGVKPKLYSPPSFEEGSSITHLDEETYSKSINDSMMTPNLGPGEAFKVPGPLVLGMLQDMLSKPKVREALAFPSEPSNVKALVGDGYALITFDFANCSRVDRVKRFVVRVSPGGIEKSYNSQPIRVNGLKNGKRYRFTLYAMNSKGSSGEVDTNFVVPQKSKTVTVIDQFAKVTGIATTQFRGKPIVIYGDEVTRSLKMAKLIGVKWHTSTIKRGIDVGPISLCVDTQSKEQALHIFYADTRNKDLLHSTIKDTQWMHEVVDGNGRDIQDYREASRTSTASDVSVSNACVVTKDGIQVFYRDETQGILLGAVSNGKRWVYEIVDGDKSSGDRTTGDVAFNLAAASLGRTVYLVYDSVLAIDSSRRITSGEIRAASRNSIYPEDWKYKTLDGPDFSTSIAGFGTSISLNNEEVQVSWLSTTSESYLNPAQIRLMRLNSEPDLRKFSIDDFGFPSNPLLFHRSKLFFGCNTRLCSVSTNNRKIELVSGRMNFGQRVFIIESGSSNILITSQEKQLVSIDLNRF
jgi:hypothetical protein